MSLSFSFKFANTEFALSKQGKFFEMEGVAILCTWNQNFSPRELQSNKFYYSVGLALRPDVYIHIYKHIYIHI